MTTTTDKPVLLVTGGSRGIGAAICVSAARQGWAVAVNYASNRAAAEAVVAAIEAEGGTAIAIEGDVGRQDGIDAIFAAVDETFGRLDGLVNNAGIVAPPQRVEEMTADRLDRLFRINVSGSILCASAAVRRMSIRRGGRGGAIVNLSSIAAVLGAAGQYVDYAATKGAIDTFTTGLSLEVVDDGIRVNAVRPGIIDTEIHASGGLPDRARALASTIPMKRPGTAQEVADAVLYLLSPSSSYVTGAILNVSGGR
ncbi:sugar dehydrogenase [Rhizobium sp. Root482]|nr:SDR family oxidoreductase [Rhizobium sp. Root482]KQY26062.1 sugar dehydrogenase [Rhizobium sp. Root482]